MADGQRKRWLMGQAAVGFVMLGVGLWTFSPAVALTTCGILVLLDAILSLVRTDRV